jgi:hypothetical protein
MQTGERVCAACGHPKKRHCPTDGCLDGVKTSDECICAKYVAELHTCDDCGRIFAERWQWQNHRMPTPTCLAGGRGAAGKYADRPKVGAPLAGQTAATVAARRRRRR